MFYLSPLEKLSNMSMVLTGPHLGKNLLFNVANPHLIHTESYHFSRFSTKIARRIGLVNPESPPARAKAPSFRDRDLPVRPVHDFMVPMGLSQKIGPPKPCGFLNFFLGK